MAQSVHLRIPAATRLLMALPAMLLLIWAGTHAPSVAAAPATPQILVPVAGALSCGPGWHTVSSPAAGGTLVRVASIPGTKQLWAVGVQTIAGQIAPLIERWNGATWSILPSPTVAGANTTLTAVTAHSARDAWAVGTVYTNPTWSTFVLHWNGTHWTHIPSPNVGTRANTLYDVAALSANDVWAVGSQTSDPTNNYSQQLVEHWDGHAWRVVAGASLSGYSILAAIARIPGTRQLLAVGSETNLTASGPLIDRTVIERWTGRVWARMPSPNVGSRGSGLLGITALSDRDAWAVGWYLGPTNGYDGGGPTSQTLIEHFNGRVWKVVSSPDVVNAGIVVSNGLGGVTALSAGDVFALGGYSNPTEDFSYPLSEHWNGSRWSLDLPFPLYTPPPYTGLSGITHIPGTSQVWAVGGDNSGPLIVVHC